MVTKREALLEWGKNGWNWRNTKKTRTSRTDFFLLSASSLPIQSANRSDVEILWVRNFAEQFFNPKNQINQVSAVKSVAKVSINSLSIVSEDFKKVFEGFWVEFTRNSKGVGRHFCFAIFATQDALHIRCGGEKIKKSVSTRWRRYFKAHLEPLQRENR